jgi:glycosyltransferase involved in cell wall biosynthesis
MQNSPAGRSPAENGSIEPALFRASVIIPTLNRPQQLLACLELLSVDFPGDSEVIVVSDGGDRDRFPDLGNFTDLLNLTVIHTEHGGPAHARNQGLLKANSPIVVFLDDDCLPHRGWFENMLDAVKLDPPVAAGGKTLNGVPDNVYSAAAQLVLDLAERDQQENCYKAVFYPSNNLAFPTGALRALGGFNPQFRTAEDRELCRRWLRAGNGLVKAPAAVISHQANLNFTSYWRKFAAYGQGAAKFHGSFSDGWPDYSLTFHFRVPALAAREISATGLRHRFALLALLGVWELANLCGFMKEKWNHWKSARANRGSAGSAE